MKPPAFPFYADDFLAGTFDLSTEEVGAYIRLLCHQWNRGSIPVEPEKQHRLAGGSVSADVIAKFELCQDGNLRNQRLEVEREKQRIYREKQAEKGRKSGDSRRQETQTAAEPRLNHGSATVEPTHEHRLNLPFPSPFPSPSTRKSTSTSTTNTGVQGVLEVVEPKSVAFAPPKREDINFEAAKHGLPDSEVDLFVAYYGSNGWRVGKNPMKSWRHALSGWTVRWRSKQPQKAHHESGF